MKASKLAIFLTALLFASLGITGCQGNSGKPAAAETYEFTDDYGNTVGVPAEPRRVVSLSPAVTEIVCALGRADLLVGRTDFCLYPPEVQSIESIGGISNLNVEKILSMNPDLVISGSMIPQKSAEHLMSLGVPMVCVIEKNRFEGLYENISKIGRLIGRPAAADSLVAALKSEMDDDRAQHAGTSDSLRPTVYYVVGFGAGGNFTAGGDTFINDLIAMAGGRNIAAGVKGWNYSLEALLDADPDYIIIRREDSASFCTTAPYTRLDAVRKGRVVAIESSTIDLQVPRNIDCVRRLREAFANSK